MTARLGQALRPVYPVLFEPDKLSDCRRTGIHRAAPGPGLGLRPIPSRRMDSTRGYRRRRGAARGQGLDHGTHAAFGPREREPAVQVTRAGDPHHAARVGCQARARNRIKDRPRRHSHGKQGYVDGCLAQIHEFAQRTAIRPDAQRQVLSVVPPATPLPIRKRTATPKPTYNRRFITCTPSQKWWERSGV